MWTFIIDEDPLLSGELSWTEAGGLEGTEDVVDYFNNYVENVYHLKDTISVMNMIVTIENCLKDGSLLFHLVREVYPSAKFEGNQEPSFDSPTREQMEKFGDSFVQ
jgi:hypothetical protein